MKDIIATWKLSLNRPWGQENILDYNFEKFKITHSFIKIDNGRNRYCIEVTYILNFTRLPDKHLDYNRVTVKGVPVTDSSHEEFAKFSFIKKGDTWFGRKSWMVDY